MLVRLLNNYRSGGGGIRLLMLALGTRVRSFQMLRVMSLRDTAHWPPSVHLRLLGRKKTSGPRRGSQFANQSSACIAKSQGRNRGWFVAGAVITRPGLWPALSVSYGAGDRS